MALVRLKLIGSGVEGDAYRVPLPTYRTIFQDHAAGTAIVDVPDTDFHTSPDDIKADRSPTSHGPMITSLSGDDHAAWHAHLDERYQEHRGEFRPEVV